MKKAAALRKLTILRPGTRNATRWTFTQDMRTRYFELLPTVKEMKDTEIRNLIPTESQNLQLQCLLTSLANFHSYTLKFQTNSMNLLQVRTLFDDILHDFLALDHYLLTAGTLSHYPYFENGIVAALEGNELAEELIQADLSICETPAVNQQEDADTVLSKTRRFVLQLAWISPTSNVAERLFSTARGLFSDYRKSTSPVN